VFSSLNPDGASAEQVIESIARTYGGGVARVFNKQLNAKEIVAVKIGRNLLVKGEPDKISEADFSQFDNADSVRKAALRSSKQNKGGIHFFLGEKGVPLGVGDSGELVFPNAEELRLKGDTGTIHIDLVDYDADPLTLRDLEGMYSDKGGIRFSEMARELVLSNLQERDLMEGHGGVRSEKLMLADTSVLIFDIEGGEMKTAMEHSAKTEGFMAPQFDVSLQQAKDPTVEAPAFHNVGLLLPTHLGPMLIPMDGSAAKVPYLFVKVFDGKAEDAVKVFEPLDEAKPLSQTKQEQKEHLRIGAPEHVKTKIIQLRKLLEAARCFCYVEKDRGVRPALVLRPVFLDSKKSDKPQPGRLPEKKLPEPQPRSTSSEPKQEAKMGGTKSPADAQKPAVSIARSRRTSPSKSSKAFKLNMAIAPKKKPRPKVRKAKATARLVKKTSKKKVVKKTPKKPKQPLREGLMDRPVKKRRATKRPKPNQRLPKAIPAEQSKPRKKSSAKPSVRSKRAKRKASAIKAVKRPVAKPTRKKKMPSHHRKEMLGLTSKKRKVSGRTKARSSR
jgi:hypothetical protein